MTVADVHPYAFPNSAHCSTGRRGGRGEERHWCHACVDPQGKLKMRGTGDGRQVSGASADSGPSMRHDLVDTTSDCRPLMTGGRFADATSVVNASKLVLVFPIASGLNSSFFCRLVPPCLACCVVYLLGLSAWLAPATCWLPRSREQASDRCQRHTSGDRGAW